MKARPILMSAPMVRALLDGRKTQTRRVIAQRSLDNSFCVIKSATSDAQQLVWRGAVPCPYGQPGDLLWVRETWGRCRGVGQEVQPTAPVIYRADMDHCGQHPCLLDGQTVLVNAREPWKPSIHMPRSASRLTLEITGVRVELLQDISDADAMAEGDPNQSLIASENTHLDWYQTLWESINGRGSWDANPWVWVLEFRVHQVNVDELLKRRAA